MTMQADTKTMNKILRYVERHGFANDYADLRKRFPTASSDDFLECIGIVQFNRDLRQRGIDSRTAFRPGGGGRGGME